MVKIVSTYARSNPISTALSAMIKGQGGSRSPYEDALDREKLYAAQRERVELENLARMAGDPNRDENALARVQILSGYRPADYNTLALGQTARLHGAEDPRTTNAYVGAGNAYSGSYHGQQASLANSMQMNEADNAAAMDRARLTDTRERDEFFNKPIEGRDPETGEPVFAPQGEAFSGRIRPAVPFAEGRGELLHQNSGRLGDLPIEEQRVLGADGGSSRPTPRNYIAPDGATHITYDGVSDARTGQPLPPGGYLAGVNATSSTDAGITTSTQSDLQKSTIALNSFQGTLSRARAIAKQDPTLFGVTGVVRSLAQGGAEALNNIGLLLGNENVGQTIAELRSLAANSPKLRDKSLVAGLFDPNLPGIRVLSDLLVFKAASALAGQSGRSVSDKDVQMFRRIVGDPRAFLESQASFLAKMDIMERELQAQIALERRALGGDLTAPPGEGVAVERGTTNEITIDIDGNIVE